MLIFFLCLMCVLYVMADDRFSMWPCRVYVDVLLCVKGTNMKIVSPGFDLLNLNLSVFSLECLDYNLST